MNNDEKIELIKEIGTDWFLEKIDAKIAINRVMLVANIMAPTEEDILWARGFLLDRLFKD